MVNKASHFADNVSFGSHTCTRTQQSLPPLWEKLTSTYMLQGQLPQSSTYNL